MTQAYTRSLSATAAMSAVLALGSTPALAQDAPTIQIAPPASSAPAVTAPPVAAPASAAPTIVLPDVTSEPTTETPVTQAPRPATTAEPRAERPASARTGTARTASAQAPSPRVARESTPATPPVSDARPSSANILNDTPVAPVAAQNETPVQAAASAPVDNTGSGFPTEATVGLLALLGIGAAGYAALRSRRRRADDAEYALTDAEVHIPAATASDTPGPVPASSSTTDVRYDFDPARSSHSGVEVMTPAAVAMEPPVAPRTRVSETAKAPASAAEDRESVLDRMVDAEPDEANPFTSRKARRKRARLLLQQQDHAAEQSATAPFDWRSYRTETRPSTPATPDLVTA